MPRRCTSVSNYVPVCGCDQHVGAQKEIVFSGQKMEDIRKLINEKKIFSFKAVIYKGVSSEVGKQREMKYGVKQ